MTLANPDSGPVTVRRISAVGNLIGAVLAFCYFRFIDYAAADLPRVALVDIVYSLVAFGLILLAGFWWGNRWTRPLGQWSGQQSVPAPIVDLVRRRALLLPYAIAMLTVVGWIRRRPGVSSGRCSRERFHRTGRCARSSASP
jgi:hypothetical protein